MTDTRKVPVVSVVGVIALVLTIGLNAIVGLMLIATRQATADYTRCSAGWQQEFGSAYRARVATVSAVDRALDRVVRAVADQDPTAFKKAVRHYVALRDKQIHAREENPLPPLPETLCGNPEEVR